MRFTRESSIEAPAGAVYDWHMRPGAFERLAPPWQAVRVLARIGEVDTSGYRVTVSVPVGPIRLRWVAEHYGVIPGSEFRDVQIRGPFRSWEHHHRFRPANEGTSVLEDAIEYTLPLGRVGSLVAGRAIERDLDRLFRYRHDTTRDDIAAHQQYSKEVSMKVLVTGATGLVGSTLIPFLTTGGHEVSPLRRPEDWNPAKGVLDRAALEGYDAVVHLAGENIASGRWSDAQKERIRASRVDGTRLLSEALAGLEKKPQVLVSASAIGYYGDRGDEALRADSEPGSGFLADVCQAWEEATTPARDAGIRVVLLRTGVVLSPKGGALAKMLTPFKLGVGGVVGSGEQYMSWIEIDDLVGMILHALAEESVAGPVNAVAPNPVTNHEFTKTLGRVLGRPTVFPLPAFAAKLAMGEMAEELLLSSARVETATSYEFRYPELEPALRHLLGR